MRKIVLMCLCFLIAANCFAANRTDESNASNKHMLLAKAPPGLSKKGYSTTPSFLGKTPPGWSQGQKRGWNKNKNWHYDKKTHYWQNKDWRWNNDRHGWVRVRE